MLPQPTIQAPWPVIVLERRRQRPGDTRTERISNDVPKPRSLQRLVSRRHRGSCAHQPSGARIQKHKHAMVTARTTINHRPLRRKPAANPTMPAAAKLGVTNALPFPKKSPGVKYPQRIQTPVSSTNALNTEPAERMLMSRALMTANDPATRSAVRHNCNSNDGRVRWRG